MRGLARRGLVRERTEAGRRYHALTLAGFMAAVLLFPATPADLLADALEEPFGEAVLPLNGHDPMEAVDPPEGEA